MRVMWKGAVSFGLVTIPVRAFGATESRSVGFHQLHALDLGRIQYRRYCSVCGKEVQFEDIVRGHEREPDDYVVVTDEELDALPVRSNHVVDILQFVDIHEIDPIYFQRSYYLVPEKIGVKAYRLLREAMQQGERVAVAKIAFRDKEHLAVVRARDDLLLLETMYWPDEIREPAFAVLETDAEVRPQELKMAQSLIESMTEPWRPEQFRDDYRDKLLELIEAKQAGRTPEAAPPEEKAEVIDLVAALKASVDAAKNKRAQHSGR
ncbi:MAG: non-homologous end joining protein Ku [Thermoleophilia bacterium]